MKKLLLLLCMMPIMAFAQKVKNHYVTISSPQGKVYIRLYNETPQHRDNFLKLASSKYYDGVLFHRVIKDFMIQGGDPNSRGAHPDSLLGNGGLDYTVPAEFNPNLFHKKGVLAAARDNNPEKASSSTQFYLVQGKVFTDSALSVVEERRLKFRLPEAQREVYKTLGGTPHLDQNYTVYGEIVKGIEMVDKIAAVETGKGDRPKTDVPMQVAVMKKREVKRLEKELRKQP